MAASPMNDAISNRTYGFEQVDDVRIAYDRWATTFEQEVLDPSNSYVGHRRVANTARACGADMSGVFLDAGCGTGLSGAALAEAGAKVIDGIDLSPAMLDQARQKGIYRDLRTADLSQPLDKADEAYDAVTCVGTMTKGHVGPVPALREFIRVTKPNGLIIATVLDEIWESGGYKAEVERLHSQQLVDIISTDLSDYRTNYQARILVLKKI